MSFGVLTLNFWNVNEPLAPRYRALEAGLATLHPDIVCLQEADRDPQSGRSQADCIAAMGGLACRVEHDGLAILSTSPVLRSDHVALPEFPGDGPRHVLFAELDMDGRPLLLANTHLAYPPAMTEPRLRQTETLLAALAGRLAGWDELATVVCGDFNDVPDSPAVLAMVKHPAGLRDCFAACRPGDAGITYSPRNGYVDRSWTLDQRIDYVFANRRLRAQACSVVLDGSGGLDPASDHFGVFCTLAFC